MEENWRMAGRSCGFEEARGMRIDGIRNRRRSENVIVAVVV